MQRRSFLLATGQALAFAMTARKAYSVVWSGQQPAQDSSDALERRVASVLQAFDAQGNHRTGTAVDNASAEWLAEQVRQLGVEPSLEPFPLSRVDPQVAYARIGNRRIDAVPMFDSTFTTLDGVSGPLGLLGSDADIGLAETLPADVAQTNEADILSRARRSRHKAVILVTGGNRPGLFLTNASAFATPAGPPMLQISNAESEWFKAQTQNRAQAMVVHMQHEHRRKRSM